MPLPTSCGSGERFKLPMQLSLMMCPYSSTVFPHQYPGWILLTLLYSSFVY